MIAPVDDARLNPAGSAGETEYDRDGVPPPPVTGVKPVAATLTASVCVAMTCVAVTAGLTVRVKLAVAVRLFASVTVTVWTVALAVAVGVPVIAPELEAMLRPVGRAGETEYASGAVPAEPVTGVKLVAAKFSVSAFEAIACVATGSGRIVGVLDAVAFDTAPPPDRVAVNVLAGLFTPAVALSATLRSTVTFDQDCPVAFAVVVVHTTLVCVDDAQFQSAPVAICDGVKPVRIGIDSVTVPLVVAPDWLEAASTKAFVWDEP